MKKTLSIVVPVFNEAENLPLFHAALETVLTSLSHYQWEVIYVNDGSVDDSWPVICELASASKRVRGIRFSRNFGNPCAIEAGLRQASGEAVVTIDADLEKPPSLIAEMVAQWEAGYLIVNAKRSHYDSGAHGRSYVKKTTSRLFYWGLNKIAEVRIEPGAADFRLVDRRVVNKLLAIREDEYFFRGLLQWTGYASTVVTYEEGDRPFGHTNYSFRKLVALASTAVTSHSTLPLKIIIPFGLLVMGIAALLLLAMSFLRFVTGTVEYTDIAFLVVFIIFNNGVLVLAIGILAIYMLRIHKKVSLRPNYITAEQVNFGGNSTTSV